MKRVLAAILVIGAMTLITPPLRAAGGYQFTTIDNPNPNSGTSVYGINNLGQIVGTYTDPVSLTAHLHGFIYDGATFTPIDSPSGPDTDLRGINDAGVIVGRSGAIGTGTFGGFVEQGGVFTSVPVDTVSGIDNLGLLVGFTESFLGPHAVFAFSPAGPLYPLDYPGAPDAWLYGVNNLGAVVGGYTRSDGSTSGYISIAGQFATTGPNVQITCINDQFVFGGFYTVNLIDHGFVYANGIATAIDVPGAVYTQVWGVNNAGTIVGTYSDGSLHGFMATPQ